MPADWLELHREDAAAAGIADGDLVTVRSRVGEIRLPVRLTERIERGTRVHGLPLPGGPHEPAGRLVV